MKILMSGPGYGNNIRPYLDFFNEQDHYKLTLLYASRLVFSTDHYEKVNFFKLNLNFKGLFSFIKLLRQDWDIIWIQGAGHVSFILAILLFKKSKSKTVVTFWNYQLPKSLLHRSVKSWIYKFALKKITFLHCYTDMIYDTMRQALPAANLKLLPSGLHVDYFKPQFFEQASAFTQEFISSLPNCYKFFFTRSFVPNSRQDLVIEAAKILKGKTSEKFAIYLWPGNESMPALYEKYCEMIAASGLQDNVFIYERKFLPPAEMYLIWQKMDCALQFVEHDIFSYALLEAMFMEKEVIASRIPPYEIYQQKNQVSFPLVANDAAVLAEAMLVYLSGNRTSTTELQQRKAVIVDHFKFDTNLAKQLKIFTSEQ